MPCRYQWSSYRHHVTAWVDDAIQDHWLYLALGADAASRVGAYEALFRSELDAETLTEIRTASRRGAILGGERFRAEIESALGARRGRGQAGRPKSGSGGLNGEQIEFEF